MASSIFINPNSNTIYPASGGASGTVLIGNGVGSAASFSANPSVTSLTLGTTPLTEVTAGTTLGIVRSASLAQFNIVSTFGTANLQLDKASNGDGAQIYFATNGTKNWTVGTQGNANWALLTNPGGINALVASNATGFITGLSGLVATARGTTVIVGYGDTAGATGAISSVAAFAVGAADGTFEIGANINVTTATLHNFTVTCTYTDESNASRTLTLGFTQLSGATLLTAITNATGTGPYESVVYTIRAKASTSITLATTGTFTTVTYNARGVIKQVS